MAPAAPSQGLAGAFDDPFKSLFSSAAPAQPQAMPAMYRALEINTQTFGSLWLSIQIEKKTRIMSKRIRTPQEYMTVMSKELSFCPVQIINNEAITAA